MLGRDLSFHPSYMGGDDSKVSTLIIPKSPRQVGVVAFPGGADRKSGKGYLWLQAFYTKERRT